jgi:hypothetical protein
MRNVNFKRLETLGLDGRRKGGKQKREVFYLFLRIAEFSIEKERKNLLLEAWNEYQK